MIADYFSKWTETFYIKNKCADTVADVLVEKIILRFGMPLVINSEFENGSSVTDMSDSLYQTLVYAGAPVGTLGCTSKTLRCANGTGIGVSGCSQCVVSFM